MILWHEYKEGAVNKNGINFTNKHGYSVFILSIVIPSLFGKYNIYVRKRIYRFNPVWIFRLSYDGIEGFKQYYHTRTQNI